MPEICKKFLQLKKKNLTINVQTGIVSVLSLCILPKINEFSILCCTNLVRKNGKPKMMVALSLSPFRWYKNCSFVSKFKRCCCFFVISRNSIFSFETVNPSHHCLYNWNPVRKTVCILFIFFFLNSLYLLFELSEFNILKLAIFALLV